ncbi:MAG: ABC transporter substrate-binding protein [SAR324 cluster bacterium]|nr:ABC transporter substrate-binding protein [SAR324 cluster bacterium]
MRLLTLFSLFFFLFSTPLFADEATEVRAKTKSSIDKVIATLKNKSLKKEQKKKQILDIVNPIFDFSKMAKISLGKQHWTSFSQAQRKEFVSLFVTRLQESYLEKLDMYTDEEVLVDDARTSKGNRIEVKTRLVSKDDSKDMEYKFYKSKKQNKWLVYDVVIMGVSVVQTYRSQFTGVLKKESVDGLLKRLRQSGQFNVPAGVK